MPATKKYLVQLVAARVAKKISQKDLATQMNIPIKIIQDIENHRYKNDMQLAQRIARKLEPLLLRIKLLNIII